MSEEKTYKAIIELEAAGFGEAFWLIQIVESPSGKVVDEDTTSTRLFATYRAKKMLKDIRAGKFPKPPKPTKFEIE